MKERIVFHIDVNNAFLSWSAVKLLNEGYKEDIRTIASVIAGDEKERRGIVLAKSPIAKKFHIVTAETLYQARRKCPTLKVFTPDYNAMGAIGDAVIKINQAIPNYITNENMRDLTGIDTVSEEGSF